MKHGVYTTNNNEFSINSSSLSLCMSLYPEKKRQKKPCTDGDCEPLNVGRKQMLDIFWKLGSQDSHLFFFK